MSARRRARLPRQKAHRLGLRAAFAEVIQPPPRIGTVDSYDDNRTRAHVEREDRMEWVCSDMGERKAIREGARSFRVDLDHLGACEGVLNFDS